MVRIAAILVVLSVCFAAALAQTGVLYSPAPRAAWSKSWAGRITDVGVSSSGTCVAVALPDAVVVLDAAGEELWQWAFARDNRFVVARSVAVAPSCDRLAFTGDASYRYTWIVHRNGRRRAIATRSTPLGVAISRGGDLVAIGTSANDVWLLGADGTTRWRRHLPGCCYVRRLMFADDDRAVFVTSGGAAVLSIDGEVRWSIAMWGMWADPSGGAFVAHWEPPHGPGLSSIALVDSAGRTLWQRFGYRGVVSPRGDLIAATVNDNQTPTECDRFEPQTAATRLLTRFGEVVGKLPGDGVPVAFSSDGRHVILQRHDGLDAVDLTGTRVWSISLPGASHLDAIPGRDALVAWSADVITWLTAQ